MDEDDFGELYDDPTGFSSDGAASLQKSYASYAIFDDGLEDDQARANAPPSHLPSSPPGALSPRPQVAESPVRGEIQEPDQPVGRDSDEDDDMLLLGYNSKSAGIANKARMNDTQALGFADPEEEFAKLTKTSEDENVAENVLVSFSSKPDLAVTLHVPGITPTEVTTSASHHGARTAGPDASSHTITIPGLSTTVSAPFFDMGDDGDVTQDAWDQEKLGKSQMQPHGGAVAGATDDWDTDSDDDLHIVLNSEYPYYPSTDKRALGSYEAGSEDEDEEDLIIFAGGEAIEDGEEQLLQPSDTQTLQGDQLGEKLPGVEDSKGQQEKAVPGVQPLSQASRGFAYHNYSSPYKYVRAGATGMYNVSSGQAPGGRGGPLKSITGRGDWRSSGRGGFGPPQFASSWSATSSLEFTLPPAMTVFEVNLDDFEEKPWRQPTVDISDFFNFGFDETSWKDYCKQLLQLKLESNMQSKIRVYESGRSEQDYDPDLPPELAAAAGLQESSEKVQQRQLDADTVGAGMGRRIYTPMPLGRPIEVEGGIADRRPSADSRKQRIRDSDSILLIDAVENEDLETEVLHDENMEGMDIDVDKDEVDQDEQQIEGHGIDEEEHLMESVRAPFKTKQEQHIWKKERMPKVQSKPPAEERRELEYAQSFDANLHEVESKADIDTSEKFTEPSDKHEIENHKDDMVHIHAEEHHGVQSISQKVEDASIAVLKEKLSWEVQADSSGCSSKRQRPVSPEGSHTASWDNLDLQKSTRSTTYTKESRDSGESAFDSREDTSRHRKKHKSYSDLSRADMHRDSRHETDFYHKRQVSNRQEVESEVHLYTESVQETTKRQKQGVSDKVTSKDFVKHSRHREDVRGRTREDDIEKKIHLVKDVREAVDHKDKVGSKSDSRRREEEERDVSHYRERGSRSESRKKEVERRDRHDSRRREPEDRRERPEKESQHREFREIHHRDTEVEPFDWHTSDRRKKEEDHRRKDRPEDSDVFTKKERGRDIFEKHERQEDDHRRKDRPADAGIFTKKERGKEILEKHERDSDLYTRKKEELSKKEKVEDRHKTKVRDGTLKDSEESRQRNTDYQDSQKRSHKDEERLSHSGRSSRRHDEDRGERAWRGRDESRMSDSTRSSEHRSHSKDRRRLLEDHGKEKGRSHEGHVRSCIDHEGAQIVENHDRDPGKHSRLSDGSRTLERSLQSDKHRIDSKRNKDFDREINEAATQSAENTAYSKRKRSVPEKNEQGSGRLEESSSAKARDGQAIKAVLGDARESHDSKFGKSSSKLQLSDDRASSAEDERQKGRSKLERWMSHKDLDSDILLRQSILKRDEKPKLSSRDEKHRDSFEARVNPQQDTKHHVGIDRKSDKGSSTEQVNGKASKLKEKGDAGTFSKGDANTDKKDEHHQEDAAVLQTNMAAKLEKRKERFKVTMEDKEGARKLVQGENQLVDKDDSRQERPPRKRRWASG